MQKDIDQRIVRVSGVLSRPLIDVDELTPFHRKHLYGYLAALEGKLLLFNSITNSTSLDESVLLPEPKESSEPLTSDDIRSLSTYMNMAILHASSSKVDIDASALPMFDILRKIIIMKAMISKSDSEIKMIKHLEARLSGSKEGVLVLEDEDIVYASKYHFMYTPIVGGSYFGDAIRALNVKVDMKWVNDDYDAVISLVTYMVCRGIFTDKFVRVTKKAKLFESRPDLNSALDRLVKAKTK
jgi:hypothetical protein